MPPSKIVLLRHSPEGRSFPADDWAVIPFGEVRRWVASGGILRHLFRYQESVALVYDLELITKPFWTALLLRLLGRREAWMTDRLGARRDVSWRWLGSLFLRWLRDLCRIPFLCGAVRSEVERLGGENIVPRPVLEMASRPVYLRTDLVFGVRSGGSVGHISGVLNQLDQFSGKPLFLTTDIIPTVRPDIETKLILPDGSFRDFDEIQTLDFNRAFLEKAAMELGKMRVSFFYQRYSLNDFSGLRLSRRFRVPLVLEYNGSEIWVARHWGRRIKHEKLSKDIELLNLRAADVTVVVSKALKDELVERGVEADRVLVNPNGVDAEKYSPSIDGAGVRKKYALDGKRVVGFIGTFGRWHGAEVLAEVFGRLLKGDPARRQYLRLLMIGDGVTMSQVKRNLAAAGVEKEAVLTGAVPQEQGPAHLAACDILVAPHVPNPDGTPFFGSPTKLFEYMAMGKGIVASDLDQIGEILRHDETAFLVKPGDPKSLVAGLRTLLENESQRSRLGKAAREEAVAKYTWKEHTRKIIEKLKERCP